MIVVDANVMVYAVTDTGHTGRAREVLQSASAIAVPRLWRAESANALVTLARAGYLDPRAALSVYEQLLGAFVRSERDVDSMACARTALQEGLSAYDAEYVTLARNLGCRLVTNDGRLLSAVPDVTLSLAEAAEMKEVL